MKTSTTANGFKKDELSKILIGWASRDITPNKPVALLGQFHVRISKYVNDPLMTTALALESGSKTEQAILVSVDACFVQNYILKRCREKMSVLIPDFNPEKLFINATHTHTAPTQPDSIFLYPPQTSEVMTPDEYAEILVKNISESVVEAWEKRCPGAVSWGCGQAVVGFNRRMIYFDGSASMYGNTDDENFSHIEGQEDHGVDILFTYDTKKILTGMVINLACPSQVTEGAHFISADFWHETREEIKKGHGKELFILPQCSAAGDQSPHLMIKKKTETRMLVLKGLMQDKKNEGFAERAEIARRITRAVDEVIPLTAKDIHDMVIFKHKTEMVYLPRRMVTENDLRLAKEQVQIHKKALLESDQNPVSYDFSFNYTRIGYFQNVIARYENQKASQTLPIEIHIIRFGDIAFATNPFELFLDYGQRIKARSKAIQTFVIQLAAGEGKGTYLPTQRGIAAQSYGTGIESCLIGPEGGQILVNESVKMINELF